MTDQPADRRSILRLIGRSPYLRAVAILAVALIGALVVRSRLKPIDIEMVLLLAVVIVAARLGRGPAVLTVVLAIVAFDFYFVPPYNTLSVLDGTYWFTFAVMFVVALIMTGLTATIRDQALEARRGERRALALYEMFRDLAQSTDLEQQRRLVGRYLGGVVDGEGEVAFLLAPPSNDGDSQWTPAESLADTELRAVANWARRHQEPAGWGTTHAANADAVVVPLRSDERDVGVGVVRPGSLDRVLEDHELRTLMILARQAAVVLDRTFGQEGPWASRAS